MADADLLTKAFKYLSSMIRNLIRPLRKSEMKGEKFKKSAWRPSIQSNRKSQTMEGRRELIEAPSASSRLLKNGLCV